MSSEWELDDGIKSIKSAWRREHTARCNLEKMLENAESENAALRTQLADVTESVGRVEERCAGLREACAELLEMAESLDPEWLHWPEMYEELRGLGVEV